MNRVWDQMPKKKPVQESESDESEEEQYVVGENDHRMTYPVTSELT